ncbi:MAG: hypothetical protein ACKOCX_13295 [Planctomycetota bacterium]
MPRRNPTRVLGCLAILLAVGSVRGELISIDVSPNGTTSNLNVHGTSLSGGVATWPSRLAYRDYQFQLSTAAGTATFDSFSVRLSASRRSSTPPENTLRASLWTGPIVPNPLLADALTTVTIANSAIPTSGFTNPTLTGPAFTQAQSIGMTPSVFFFRVWAEGDGSNSGYATKMANSLGEFQAITMAESASMNADVALDLDNDGVEPGETYDMISEVPEPSAGVIALAAAGAALAWRRLQGRS